jgi:3'-phosphoadenosine 5'-phosphosulfate sulfotransferase (PAPS reductase)/FAD synthetase
MKNDIVAWWSGGITSAVACKIAIDIFGIDRVRIVMIDTFNEDDDTYRFKSDCEVLYGKKIEVISEIGLKHESIEDVWYKYKSLNVANGAVCSSELKRNARKRFQKNNSFTHQVFGFDISEPNRAKAMTVNYPEAKAIYPLLLHGLSKEQCIKIFNDLNVKIPNMYSLGFKNNNCFKTGCVQGGIGYWQKMMIEFPDKFEKMAKVEHDLTELKGSPVTMLKDQSNAAKDSGLKNVFLKHNKKYPNIKDISMMKGFKVEPLTECNGFCGTNDLEPRSSTEKEINYEQTNLFD